MVGLPIDLPLRRLRGTDLWYRVIDVPRGSRIEYRLAVTRDGNTESIEDPRNPSIASNPMGTESVLMAEGYETPSWALPTPGIPEGRLAEMEIQSRALGRTCRVTLYLPARVRLHQRHPLLIVHDGGDFLVHAQLGTVLDTLMHRHAMADAVVALLYPEDRLKEYGASAAHARFVTTELVPQLEREWPLRGEPAGRCLMGSSFGAIASISTAWRSPGFYGSLILQSASFLVTAVGNDHGGGPVFDPVVRFVSAMRSRPKRLCDRAYISCGAFEPMVAGNRAMLPVLQGTGTQVRYTESLDGHNWTSWRDRLGEAFGFVLPGEARLVYP